VLRLKQSNGFITGLQGLASITYPREDGPPIQFEDVKMTVQWERHQTSVTLPVDHCNNDPVIRTVSATDVVIDSKEFIPDKYYTTGRVEIPVDVITSTGELLALEPHMYYDPSI